MRMVQISATKVGAKPRPTLEKAQAKRDKIFSAMEEGSLKGARLKKAILEYTTLESLIENELYKKEKKESKVEDTKDGSKIKQIEQVKKLKTKYGSYTTPQLKEEIKTVSAQLKKLEESKSEAAKSKISLAKAKLKALQKEIESKKTRSKKIVNMKK